MYRSHHRDQDGPITGTERTDELLGGHGHDIIDGGGGGDVIRGDFKPCCQPAGQRNQLRGGWGNDYIYASHGFNDIDSGPGNDVVQRTSVEADLLTAGPATTSCMSAIAASRVTASATANEHVSERGGNPGVPAWGLPGYRR